MCWFRGETGERGVSLRLDKEIIGDISTYRVKIKEMMYCIWLLKSVHFMLLIEREEFIRLTLLPVSTTQLSRQGLPAGWPFVWSVSQPPLLRRGHLFPAEVSRNWVHPSLVHVVLIYFNWVPVVEVVPRPPTRKTHNLSSCLTSKLRIC